MRPLVLLIITAVLVGMDISPKCAALSRTQQSDEDSSLLRPTDSSYPEAMKFAEFLREHSFKVESLHRSKLEGFFRGVPKAAFIRTDKGVVEVIFFADPGSAEKVETTERMNQGRYIYTFSGQPQPDLASDKIDAAYPIYFVTHDNQFIVTQDAGIAATLRAAFRRR